MNIRPILEIIYEDAHILVCKKPPGIATQSRNTRTPDIESLIKRHLYQNNAIKQEPYLAVIHRLDQPVSGLLVFAKTKIAASNLNKQLQAHGFGKHYKAVLTHQPPVTLANQPLIHYMKKDSTNNRSSICEPSDNSAKKAVLNYEIISTPSSCEWNLFSHCNISNLENVTMVHVTLETGRHHQIRLQMSHLGCPILGDTKYHLTSNSNCTNNTSVNDHSVANNWEHIALCAYRLDFKHPITKKNMSFSL